MSLLLSELDGAGKLDETSPPPLVLAVVGEEGGEISTIRQWFYQSLEVVGISPRSIAFVESSSVAIECKRKHNKIEDATAEQLAQIRDGGPAVNAPHQARQDFRSVIPGVSVHMLHRCFARTEDDEASIECTQLCHHQDHVCFEAADVGNRGARHRQELFFASYHICRQLSHASRPIRAGH
ncbi:hypothetical protein OBBRIDRAFT_808380 [Obba rivulosa]|uniref:Uncharacterized protein n=1 Tax=Obba rivulosa TaxID=1052685 RepID=A0A8E2AIX0_9APHY|nr:hypothetical protein OBBRIDRAFT_808380 [Obba rivulosa]